MNRRCRKRRINDGVIERWFAVNFSANDDTYYYYALFGLLNSPTRVILIPRLINRFRHRDVFHRSLLFISHPCQHCKLHDCTVHTHFGLKLIKKNIYLNFMANGGWPFFPHSFSQPIAAQPNTKLQFLSEPTTPFILLRLTPSLLLFVDVFFFYFVECVCCRRWGNAWNTMPIAAADPSICCYKKCTSYGLWTTAIGPSHIRTFPSYKKFFSMMLINMVKEMWNNFYFDTAGRRTNRLKCWHCRK